MANPRTMYTVAHNTDLAVSWIEGPDGRVEGTTSQDIPALRAQCKEMNLVETEEAGCYTRPNGKWGITG